MSQVDMLAQGADQDVFAILCVGALEAGRCRDDLLEAFYELQLLDANPSRLLLAGECGHGSLERLQEQIAYYGLQDRIDLLGNPDFDALQKLYRRAGAFLSLDAESRAGAALIEALRQDVPIVARDGEAVAAVLGCAGLRLRDGSPREIAAALKLLRENPGLRRRILQSQRRRLAQSGAADPIPPLLDYRFEGPFDSSYSLAVVNREMALAMARSGAAAGLFSTEGTGDFPPSEEFLANHPDVAELWRHTCAPHRSNAVLRNLYPPRVAGMSGVIHAMNAYGWEESVFSPAYAAGFNRHLDVLPVMSRYVAKVMADNGVKVPAAVVGLGADHILAAPPKPVGRPLGKCFRFLHVSSCFPRKGVDVLLSAYGMAFSADDEVTLAIKTFPNPHNSVAGQIRALRAANPDYPDVVLIEQDLEESQVADLYRNCHALVAPSRGEGFGLPMAEAMLFDLPVITTGYGGQTDFCSDETAWLIDYRFARAQSHMGLYSSVWAEPDAAHLARLMREVHDASPETVCARTEQAKAVILARYKWSDAAQRLQLALHAAEKFPMLYPQPKIGWVSTWHSKCGIATYSEYLLSALPQGEYAVFANRNAELLEADDERIVRCWESGGDDSLDGLHQALLGRGVEAVVIQFNFGFFDLSCLGGLIRRLKEGGLTVFIALHSTADVCRPGIHKSLGQILPELALADRLLVHGIADLNRLKEFGLTENVVLFPHGVSAINPALDDAGRGSGCRSGFSPTCRPEARPTTVGRRIVASYGFLLPHKGVRQLIQAFTQLMSDTPELDLRLLLLNALYPAAESVEEQAACRELIERSGFAGRITMINDFLDDAEVLRRLAEAELIVYPYQHTQESASGAVRIGLASGRPVAVTPLAIFEDIAGVTLTLPGVSVEELAQGIAAFLARPAVLAQCAEKQQAWLEAHRWPVLAGRLADMLVAVSPPPVAAGG